MGEGSGKDGRERLEKKRKNNEVWRIKIGSERRGEKMGEKDWK